MKKILLTLACALLVVPFHASAANKSCGNSGQRPCWIYEDFPGCKPNLVVNRENVCVHPKCGAHGESPCALTVRANPCDWGLVLNLQGKCVSVKEAADPKQAEWLAEFAQCKYVVSLLQGGKIPPELQPVLGELKKGAAQVQARLASMERQAREFVQKDAATFKEVNRVVMILKNDASKLAAFRKLLVPDEICARRSFTERARQLSSLGLLPKLPGLHASNSYGEPRFISVAQNEPLAYMLVFSDGLVGAAAVQGEAEVGIALSWGPLDRPTSFRAGPIAILSVGGAARAAVERLPGVRFYVAPEAEFAQGMDGFITFGGGGDVAPFVEIGIGVEVIWGDTQVRPYPTGGKLAVEGGLSLAPAFVGAGGSWHWILLPKSWGGAL